MTRRGGTLVPALTFIAGSILTLLVMIACSIGP